MANLKIPPKPQNPKNPVSSQTLDSKESERPLPTGPEQGSTIPQLKEEHADAVREKRHYKKREPKTGTGIQVDTEKRDRFIEGLSLFGSMVLDIATVRMPNPKPATDLERKIWNNGISQLGEKYFPAISNWDAELAFGLAVVIVFGARLKKEPEDATPSGDGSR
jgi:hypothetical protein